ncbi:hypothetical protein HNR46_001019 [Haloferula luteola]|uniref:DUF5077 domain-containing protein n=1 Tax=Haloferula luteola TaxID=595692 RepID=A0A840UYH0_9BACT|nr:DUF3472 domain-containing protein [Haloferula luteola]MBB5350785.1 hypothetical protein [Haloferula luteola]
MRKSILSLTLPSILLHGSFGAEPDSLADRQCRSVHLAYQAPPAQWACIEVTPTQSSPGTYFCALGFSRGYLGMQELADGRKVVLFSVWDSPDAGNLTDRPEHTDPAKRTGVVQIGKGVREQRFGGEGTGSQSFFEYPWSLEKPVRFAVHSYPEGSLTTYTGFFYDDSRHQWQLMASFRTATRDALTGLYSFIEDFRRNQQSAHQQRRAEFHQAWAQDLDGNWQPLLEAQFTADSNPSHAIDAGTAGTRFFLQTGGATRNIHQPLGSSLSCAPGPSSPPDLPVLPNRLK